MLKKTKKIKPVINAKPRADTQNFVWSVEVNEENITPVIASSAANAFVLVITQIGADAVPAMVTIKKGDAVVTA